jgi:hypothetical protein
MKYPNLMYMTLTSILAISASFEDKDEMGKIKIKITGSTQIFTATLLDNDMAIAFKKLLPLTINMHELNNNEKFGDLPHSLPTNPSIPKTITTGDLMIYGSKTLVLFYKTFTTSYSYTKLGQIDDAAGLASALGKGDITITFEVE